MRTQWFARQTRTKSSRGARGWKCLLMTIIFHVSLALRYLPVFSCKLNACYMFRSRSNFSPPRVVKFPILCTKNITKIIDDNRAKPKSHQLLNDKPIMIAAITNICIRKSLSKLDKKSILIFSLLLQLEQ